LSRFLSVGDITVDSALVETNQHGRSLQTYSDHGSGLIKRNQIASTKSRIDKVAGACVDYSNVKIPSTTGSTRAKESSFKEKSSDEPIEEAKKRSAVM
jgi:hypothetical protein